MAPLVPWHALFSCLGVFTCVPCYCLVGQGKVFSPYSVRRHSGSVRSGQEQHGDKFACLCLHWFFPLLPEASGVSHSSKEGTELDECSLPCPVFPASTVCVLGHRQMGSNGQRGICCLFTFHSALSFGDAFYMEKKKN